MKKEELGKNEGNKRKRDEGNRRERKKISSPTSITPFAPVTFYFNTSNNNKTSARVLVLDGQISGWMADSPCWWPFSRFAPILLLILILLHYY